VPRIPDPRTDRDLYLAFDAAAAKVVAGDTQAGYELIMAEVVRWWRRVTPAPAAPSDDRTR
jgi:hypothetical protein